jgi:multidrug resistance efflux pump
MDQPQHIDGNIQKKMPHDIKAFDNIYYRNRKYFVSWILYVVLILLFAFLLLPWTQNIRSKGFVTTLYQNDRPQQLVSQIPGKILKWYIKEGDMVNAGDTNTIAG